MVGGAADEISLEAGSLLIAAHADSSLDRPRWTAELDALSAAAEARTFDGIREVLFGTYGFQGNRTWYEDPANSLLHRVLERRLGIPITLSVVMIETGARIGVTIEPIGMPGHFLVRDAASGRYCDAYNGGVTFDEGSCRRRFEPITTRNPGALAPVSSNAVLSRILSNLEHGPLGRDLTQLAWMLRLHEGIPNLAPAERLAVATRLETIGGFDRAARQLELILDEVSGLDDTAALEQRVRALRSRAN